MSARQLNSNVECALLLHTLINRGQKRLTADDYLKMAQIARKKGYPEVAQEMLNCANELNAGKPEMFVS